MTRLRTANNRRRAHNYYALRREQKQDTLRRINELRKILRPLWLGDSQTFDVEAAERARWKAKGHDDRCSILRGRRYGCNCALAAFGEATPVTHINALITKRKRIVTPRPTKINGRSETKRLWKIKFAPRWKLVADGPPRTVRLSAKATETIRELVANANKEHRSE